MKVWRLGPERVQEWRALRLEALLLAPAAFGSRYEDWAERPLSAFRQRLIDARHFAAGEVIGDPLAGACWQADMVPGQPRQGWIMAVYVRPHARGQGYGEAVLRAIAEDAAMRGMTSLGLHVHVGNLAAQRLYERLGFVDVGEEGVVNDFGEPELRMWRQL